MDTQIAALAIANGLTVVSADRHLAMVPGLRVENWLEAPPSDEDTP
jgi:predicted nucleic acid-binding protein